MAYNKLFELTTRESIGGNRRVCQVIPVPTGRMDKASVYLEPEIDPNSDGSGTFVVLELYAVDAQYVPVGLALASDRKSLADVATKSYYNFSLQANCSTTAALVMRLEGDPANYVAWTYVSVSGGGEPMGVSLDDGLTWQQDYTRKMNYVALSLVPGAVTFDDERYSPDGDFDNTDARADVQPDIIQSAYIAPGTLDPITANSREDFQGMTLDRAVVIGDTIAIDFGTYVITLVVDQSGSMTWNDREGLRFDFLKSLVDDLTSKLAAASIPATYYFSIGLRSDDATWSSLDPWTSGFVEAQAGVTYDVKLTLSGLAVTLEVYDGTTLVGKVDAVLPEPLSDLGVLTDAILGRASGTTTDDSWISLALSDVKVTLPGGSSGVIVLQDDLHADLGWHFDVPGSAVFTGSELDLTTTSGQNQVGLRSLAVPAGDNFVLEAKVTIDAAHGWYDSLVGLSSGRTSGYKDMPAGVWIQAGFEKATSSSATYSVLKFRGRQVARLRLLISQDTSGGSGIQEVVLARNGVVIYEGLGEQFIDRGDPSHPLPTGVTNVYTIYSLDEGGRQSDVKTVLAAPMASPKFPVGLAGAGAAEEVILDFDDLDVGKRRVKVSWNHPKISDAQIGYQKIYVVRRDDRFPESTLDGMIVLEANSWDAAFTSPFYDFNSPLFDKTLYPAAGLTYYYSLFTENQFGVKCLPANSRKVSVKISFCARPWESGYLPIPWPRASFDAASPPDPTSVVVTPGIAQLKVSWTGNAAAKRYEVYYGEFSYPAPGIDPATKQRVYSATDASGKAFVVPPTYSGAETSFVHDGLDNYEPCYYVIVAYDAVGNYSGGVQGFGRPTPEPASTDVIIPDPPSLFSAAPYNATAVVLNWKLALPDQESVTAYFDDRVRVLAIATFADDSPAASSALLNIEELERTVQGYNVDDIPRNVLSDTFGATTLTDIEAGLAAAQAAALADDAAATTANQATNLDAQAAARADSTQQITVGGQAAAVAAATLATSLPDLSVDGGGNIVINPLVAASFSHSTSPTDSNIAIGSFVASSDPQVLEMMEKVSTTIQATLSVTSRSTGQALASIYGGSGQITLENPFGISIQDDPPQKIHVRTAWNNECCCPLYVTNGCAVAGNNQCLDQQSQGIGWACQELAGAYTILGGSFTFSVTATWKSLPITTSVPLTLRLLDAATGIPSQVARLQGSGTDGTLVVNTQFVMEEIIDRAGGPSGSTTQKSKAVVTLPPQEVPGSYLLEATATYNGYSRRVTLPLTYQNPLNVDVMSKPFAPDGVSVAEQMAFVYLGDPTWPQEQKVPVPDGTIVTWGIRPGGSFRRSRPFYSKENVAGTGIKSVTKDGIARNVFFGPGSDIQPFDCSGASEPCTPYEWYTISAEATSFGTKTTGYAPVMLSPSPDPTNEAGLNRIYLRPLNADLTPGFSAGIIPADGEAESEWEIPASARLDGDDSDQSSGAYFYNSILNLGGIVPDLPEGTVVTIYLNPYGGDPTLGLALSDESRDLVRNSGIPEIKTDLTNGYVQARYAKATVINGKASFSIRLDALVLGKNLELPLDAEASNIVYGQPPVWTSSPLVYYLTATAAVTVGGKPLVLWAGGRDLKYSTPPCWLSFTEPLGTQETA